MKKPGAKKPQGKIWVITRPEADSVALAETLEKRGLRTLIEPMLAIEPLIKNKKQLTTVLARKPQAILITSKHAIATLAQMTSGRSIAVIAVGDATADAACELGFKVLATANGTAKSLITTVKKRCKANAGRLLYIRGADISTDLAQALTKSGFKTDSLTLYRAWASTQFSTKLQNALGNGKVGGVMFFSERTAASYIKLASKDRLEGKHSEVCAIAISKKVATALRALPWKDIHVTGKPETRYMLDKVNSLQR